MVEPSFSRALALTLGFEGGFSDNPADPGGATNRGITLATFVSWRGGSLGKTADLAALKALSLAEAEAIYRVRYWLPVCADRLPAGPDLALFDLAVNSGLERAVKILQQALDLPVSGILTGATLAKALATPPAPLAESICRLRLTFLERLAVYPVFGRGWNRRVAAIGAAARQLSVSPVPAIAGPAGNAPPGPGAANPSTP